MKKRRILFVGVLLIFFLCFFYISHSIAYSLGDTFSTAKDCCQRPPEYWNQVVEQDRSFFLGIQTSPNTMASGAYVFEVCFAGEAKQFFPARLKLETGKLDEPPKTDSAPSIRISDFKQDKNVVSWSQFDIEEGPETVFLGVIDGDHAYGKAYTLMNTGWRACPPAFGVWTLRLAQSGGQPASGVSEAPVSFAIGAAEPQATSTELRITSKDGKSDTPKAVLCEGDPIPAGGISPERALEIARDSMRNTKAPEIKNYDSARYFIRYITGKRVFVVDFPKQGEQEAPKGVWPVGYRVVIEARTGRVADTDGYER